ncbi:hypothetical protein JCM10207_000132 [Rhodosporidiobolus poonsookiae]
MDSGEEAGQPQKKRRVTKACDQCRRRRIKCESYPGKPLDAACVICTEAGNAHECTYSRPTKKRGPQAGRARSLEEKNAVYEKLLGHLILTVPNLTSYVEGFVSGAASSPAATSSSTLFTTPEQQRLALESSNVLDLLDSVLPSSTSGGSTAIDKTLKAELPSPATSSLSYPSPSAAIASMPRKVAPLPSPSLSAATLATPSAPAAQSFLPTPSGPSFSLHALAVAAATDDSLIEDQLRGIEAGRPREDPLAVPSLPSESVRNALLDLYFNQVVHPYFPMLDKSRFLRWSAHLPSTSSSSVPPPPPSTFLIPPALYLSVFAIASAYLPPASAVHTHSTEVWAQAARAHLMDEMLSGEGQAGLETVQAAVLCALSDWGRGELTRAWLLSSLSLALSLSRSFHLSASLPPDPDNHKLKTFHSALILHTLLSLRLDRPPLIVLEDYDVPIPPADGAENFELWRSDKTVVELRADWAPAPGTGTSRDEGTAQIGGSRVQAVRSASLTTFASLAALCAIGIAVLRWGACPRRGNGQGLASGEQERQELVASLEAWQSEMERELRLGDGAGVERLDERARWTVEMHMVVATLYLKLKPHPSYASTTPSPLPYALGLLNHLLGRYRALYTLYRSLPTLDLVLDSFAQSLFDQSDYAPGQHDTVLSAYEELGRVFPAAAQAATRLAAKVDEHKRALGLLRGIHPTVSSHPPPGAAALAPAPSAEPFKALLSYSQELGPAAPAATVLDFGMWDQTDLLVSLGLVMDPSASSGPPAAASTNGAPGFAFPPALAMPPSFNVPSHPMPPVIPPSAAAPLPPNHISPPPQLQQPSPSLPAPPMATSPPTDATPSSMQTPAPAPTHYPQSHPPPAAPALFLPSFDPAVYAAPFAFSPSPHPFAPPFAASPAGVATSGAANAAAAAPLFDDANFSALPGDWPSTDLVTRWMDRGSLFGGFEGLGGGEVTEGAAGESG